MHKKRTSSSLHACIIIFYAFIVLCPISLIAGKTKGKNAIQNDRLVTGDAENAGGKADKNKDDEDAQADLYEYEKPVIEEESYPWLVVKTLIVIGALVGGFYYFFKFVTKKAGITTLGEEVIKVLSIVPVGQNKYLQVVDISGKVLVLGVTDTNINMITEVIDKDEVDRIRLLSSKSVPVQPGGFQQYITKNINRLIEKGVNLTSNRGESAGKVKNFESDRMDYLKKQKDRLKSMNGSNDEK